MDLAIYFFPPPTPDFPFFANAFEVAGASFRFAPPLTSFLATGDDPAGLGRTCTRNSRHRLEQDWNAPMPP